MPSPTDPADPPGGRDLLRAVAAGTATVTGEAFFRSLTRHLAAAFDAEVAFVAELLGEPPDRGRVLAISHNGADLREGYEFAIEGTPCALVLEDDVVSFPEGTCARFPHDEFTVRHGLDAYLAVAMRGSAGDHIGYIGVQSTRRLEPDADERAALAIFGARAAAEIERRRHEVALRAREAEVAASRVRIVEAADEERRRIGRNLHDGAQQRLVALGHLLAMAERRLAEGPDAAAPLLDQAREQSVLAADELRELVRGLHPAVPLHVDALPARRLPAVGGTLRVDSPPGAGTCLEASIALAPWRTAREPFLEFGHENDGGLGERLLTMVLEGRKTVSVALAREWDLEGGPPRPGQRIPVLDASGAKRATVEVVRTTVVPFFDVDDEMVAASEAGVASAQEWRALQRTFYDGCREEVALLLGEPGWRLTDDEPMVVTWFTRVE